MNEGKKSKEIFSNLIPDLSEKILEEDDFPISEELQNDSNRYSDNETVGKGGMKEILASKDKITSRCVARAKLYKSDDPELVELFFKEARLTAHLEHPNIMPLYDMGYDDSGEPYFTMKLIDGQSLGTLLKSTQQAKNNFRELMDIFLKVCDAISYAHSKNIVHLDLKPDNIYLGKFGEVVVCDWGLAKYIGDDEVILSDFAEFSNEATLHGIIKGTPGYMAPEQIDHSLGPRETLTDIYSLGGILYSLLTNQQPITKGDLEEVCRQTLDGDIKKPEEISSSIPKGLAAVAMKALSIKPEERYQNVEDLKKDIVKWLEGYLTSAEDQSSIKALQLMIKRHKALTLFLSILFVSSVMFSIVVSIKEQKAVAALAKYEAEKKEKEQAGKEAAPRLSHLSLVAFKSFDYDLSQEFLKQALIRDPDSDEAWQLKARYAFFNQDFNAAREAIQKVHFPATHKAVSGLRDLLPKMPENRMLNLEEFTRLIKSYSVKYDAEFLYLTSVKKYPFEDQLKMCRVVLKEDNKLKKLKFILRQSENDLSLDLSQNSKLEKLKAILPFPITHLNISKTKVSDLSQLVHLPIKKLNVANSAVKRFEPLLEIPGLQKLVVNQEQFDRGIELGETVEIVVE